MATQDNVSVIVNYEHLLHLSTGIIGFEDLKFISKDVILACFKNGYGNWQQILFERIYINNNKLSFKNHRILHIENQQHNFIHQKSQLKSLKSTKVIKQKKDFKYKLMILLIRLVS